MARRVRRRDVDALPDRRRVRVGVALRASDGRWVHRRRRPSGGRWPDAVAAAWRDGVRAARAGTHDMRRAGGRYPARHGGRRGRLGACPSRHRRGAPIGCGGPRRFTRDVSPWAVDHARRQPERALRPVRAAARSIAGAAIGRCRPGTSAATSAMAGARAIIDTVGQREAPPPAVARRLLEPVSTPRRARRWRRRARPRRRRTHRPDRSRTAAGRRR